MHLTCLCSKHLTHVLVQVHVNNEPVVAYNDCIRPGNMNLLCSVVEASCALVEYYFQSPSSSKTRMPIPCPFKSLPWSWWYCPFNPPTIHVAELSWQVRVAYSAQNCLFLTVDPNVHTWAFLTGFDCNFDHTQQYKTMLILPVKNGWLILTCKCTYCTFTVL